MKSVWIEGLEDDASKELRGDFLSSHLVRKRMKKILEDKIESKRVSVRKEANYDKANWDNYIADSLGYERALAEVISLIEEK